jgi:hypothetical protein
VRLFLAGQRQRVALRLTASTVDDAVTQAREQHAAAKRARRKWYDTNRYVLRVNDGGRVRCHRRSSSRYYTPPYFHGHVTTEGVDVVLTGTIREARSERFMTMMFSTVAVLLLAIAVVCAVERPIVVPALVICGIGALVTGPLSVALRTTRLTRFRSDAPQLEAKLAELFGAEPGQVQRPADWWMGMQAEQTRPPRDG